MKWVSTLSDACITNILNKKLLIQQRKQIEISKFLYWEGVLSMFYDTVKVCLTGMDNNINILINTGP